MWKGQKQASTGNPKGRDWWVGQKTKIEPWGRVKNSSTLGGRSLSQRAIMHDDLSQLAGSILEKALR